jgi:putative ABC transport system ATP-binding protein
MALSEGNRMPLMYLKEVEKKYPGTAEEFVALRRISLEIYPGEFIGLIGKSGAGKTTLLNMISGVDRLTSGEIWMEERCISRMNETQRARWRRKSLGVIYQSFQLLPTLNLLNNIMLPVDFDGNFHPLNSPEKAMELLDEMGIAEHAGKIPSQLSGGQQQRVAIARALMNNPRLLIADEPTGSLDSTTADVIISIFKKLVEDGITILMASHDVSLSDNFTRIIEIADGEIVSQRPSAACKN